MLVHTIKKIINATWGMDEVNVEKLAKYLRCLIHLTITDNIDIAGPLLDQAYAYADAASEVRYLDPLVGYGSY